jgi:DNA-binding IclR family transcriptional regulator
MQQGSSSPGSSLAKNTETPQVGSVTLAFAILKHLGGDGARTGVTAIARGVGGSPSSCFNILKTLTMLDVVRFDPDTKTYALGDGLLELTRNMLRSDDVVAQSMAQMDALADRFDATVGLWRLSANGATLIAKSENTAHTRIHIVIGQRQPEGAGAGGRCVMAWRTLNKATAAEIHGKIRWQGGLTATDYWRDICETRERGWAIDENDLIQGITSVASPILDASDTPRFYLSISVFSGRHTPAALAAMGKAVKAAAREIARAAYGDAIA